MKKISGLVLISLLWAGCNFLHKKTDPAESNVVNALSAFVDPYIGSDYHGHVFVGASVPFGAVQLGPNNFYRGWDWCSGYHYSDSILLGFSHTRLSGTGCTDLGDILIMPATGQLHINQSTPDKYEQGYASLYRRETEIVKPGYYAVELERYGIFAELTSTERVGMHRYSVPENEKCNIIIDLKHGNEDKAIKTFLKQTSDSTIAGYRISNGWSMDQRIYFVLKASRPIQAFTIYDDSIRIEGNAAEAMSLKGVMSFSPSANPIVLKVGISPVSIDNALLNLGEELPGWDFDQVRKNAEALWEKELSRIKIKSDKETQRIFYTALYHTMIAPTLYNDVNGDYLGADKVVYNSKDFNNYTTFSLWDTYRAANPLFTLLQPERTSDFINSMLRLYQQEGKLPEWHLMGHDNRVMIGYNAVPVVVDAYFKGIKGFDKELAYKAVVETAMNDNRGGQFVKSNEFIPSDKETESVAKALEYAIYDWGIAQMAKDMQKNGDFEYFEKRSKFYKHYFDSRDGFFKGKKYDGTFRGDFDPVKSSHREDEFCEGNGWQYLWLVNHDVDGLIKLLGGNDKFIRKLDSLFVLEEKLNEGASADISGLIGMYAHGNEPCHHIAYLFTYAGQQWKSAEKTRQIMREMYTDQPDGLCGNEDCGQMSAWYIWSSLGFYPVNPQNGVYVFGSPAVDEAEITGPEGKSFKIAAHNNSTKNIYIQSVKLNGKDYTRSYILHRDIVNGGILEFFMGDQPNKQFGSATEDLPQNASWNLK